MFLLGPRRRLVVSASDLRTASVCEFALVAELDVLRGLRTPAVSPPDPMLARVAELGEHHEQAELRRLSRVHPGRVVQFARPEYTPAGLAEAMAGTLAALESGAEVIVQATLFDGGFVGHADFLELTDEGWLVSDTKLARTESVPALLQVAAYAATLRESGVATAPTARLVFGSGEIADIPLEDILPVYRARRARLDRVLADHHADSGPARWGDDRWLACGRCEVCAAEVESARDLQLVAGLRGPTRRRLIDAGVRSIDDLATLREPVPDVRESTVSRLREQARLQLEQEADPAGGIRHEVVDETPLRMLPAPSPGDVFFDFEGDPLWQEPGSPTWGLEYLFGLVEVDTGEPVFRAFWAHDRAAERDALVQFVEYLTARRRRWPDLHVYHYAPYEPAALLRLAARHAVVEDDVDQLLRDGVLVDLYAVVRAAVRVSQRSYSLKKLEPLYMPGRVGAVTSGDQSIVVYHQYLAATAEQRADDARGLLTEIADYNRDDCVSTWLLRDWLISRVPGPRATAPPAQPGRPPSETRRAALELEATLRALVDEVPVAERTPEQRAVALVAAAVLFHSREDKPAWQEHFERLRVPTRDWRGADGVFVVERAEIVAPWAGGAGRRRPRRRIRLHGEPMRGIPMTTTSRVSAIYAVPAPAGVLAEPNHANARSTASVEIVDVVEHLAPNGLLAQTLVLEELQPRDGGPHQDLPIALVPQDVIRTGPIDQAIAEVADEVRRRNGALPDRCAVDVLLRRPPRLRGGGPLPGVGSGDGRHADAITDALLAMDDSYVAVQGPPGTGKTHVGAQVLARLVERGWRIGVSSQGHAAVENLLTAAVRAGVPPERVAKEPKATAEPEWTALPSADGLAGFAAAPPASGGAGYVIGGSAWDFTNATRVQRGQLDLLVIDEAGQFSLAKMLGVSVSARRLLLLGDPQQLPQVSTGTHAEPVDTSALGWLLGEGAVLAPSHGYFLETTWRMHPALTTAVSRLSYAGMLRSAEQVTARRRLDGVEPGLHLHLVDHRDNSTRSPQEADAVLALLRSLLGRTWHDPTERSTDGGPVGPRGLAASDILVITPYNAQVGVVRRHLEDAGVVGVRVGTVDRFQGQEAAVAIVTMAASAPTDVSRGMGFLLDRQRLNVAISRAQHSVFLVRSELLTDFSPRSPGELRALGAFLRLCDEAVATERVAARSAMAAPA
jgi:predicted RecB family nuclease